MNRLQGELQRLYASGPDPDTPARVDQQGLVRAMVLELARPADWTALSAVWGGVQSDLDLPAPGIAVNGRDGCQLWFSLLDPVPVAQAAAFLDALRRRYLGDIAAARVAMRPAPDAAAAGQAQPARPVPAVQGDSGRWSAFVASDLVPMFADEPWLDLPPNPDGQARLLAPLKSMRPAEFVTALQRLVPTVEPQAPAAAAGAAPSTAAAPGPRRFLLDAMNDETLDMALRIEAAKALLPYVDDGR